MITAKDLRGTYAHKQLRDFINLNFPHLTPGKRACRLGMLTRRFLYNRNKSYPEGTNIRHGIAACFIWHLTPEGDEFWRDVDNCRVTQYWPGPKAKQPAVQHVVKKPVGWWG